MEASLTKAQARAFRARWRLVNGAERDELRKARPARKLRQLAALMASARVLGQAGTRVPFATAGSQSGASLVREVPPFAPLAEVLKDLLNWLGASQVQGIVIGGVAASLLGRPRLTRDVDVLVLLDRARWQEFVIAGATFGFLPRRSDLLRFAERAHILLMRHARSEIDVDVVIGGLPFEEESLARAVVVSIGALRVPLPTAEDLIVMKAVARRPRDLADIESLLDAHPKLDLRRVRRWVREFAATLETPEILEDLERVLDRRRTRPKRRR